MKKISVVIPCYNEEKSIEILYKRLKKVIIDHLADKYEYEIIFVDDASKDCTEDKIMDICAYDSCCKAVFNEKNFGFHRNVFAAFSYAQGDAVFLLFGDLQDPPERLPDFVRKWEEGFSCIVGQKTKSSEGICMKIMRKCYYHAIKLLSTDTKQIQDMNGYGLYDRKFVDILSDIEEVSPYLKAVIAEYGMNLYCLPYEQDKGLRGKSNFNFYRNYDFAMYGITTSTKLLMRLATFIGLAVGFVSLIATFYVVIRKLLFWDSYPLGVASIIVGVLLIGSVQLFFIGVLGEYILSINERVARKPRVVVKKKIGFEGGTSNGRQGKSREITKNC